METKTLKLTISVDYTTANKQTSATDLETIAAMICERVNAHNHTIEEGIKIENVELCNE